MFRALLLDQTADGMTTEVVELDDERLPDGDVTVDVEYSTRVVTPMLLRIVRRTYGFWPPVRSRNA